MSNLPRKKRAVKPALIDWRWLHRSTVLGPRLGVVEIHGTAYAVTLLPGGVELRKNDGTVYHVCTEGAWGWSCDCPDAEFRAGRPGGCKHIVNLHLALLAINYVPQRKPAPAVPGWVEGLLPADADPAESVDLSRPPWEGP